MQRRLLLAVLVALVVFALVTWLRDAPRQTDSLAPGNKSDVVEVASAPAPLVAPGAGERATERTEVASAEAESAQAAPPPRTESWTGLRVRTVSRDTRAPIAKIPVSARTAGSRVSIHAVAGSRGTIAERPSTDADGYAELVIDAGFVGTVHAYGLDGVAGFESATIDTPLASGEVRDVVIELPTALDVVLHGRVIDRETGAPIPGAQVGPSLGLGKIRDDLVQRTDADGRFRVEGATWRPHVVQVLAIGYEPAALRVGPGHADATTALEIALSRSASARITVSGADGAPIAGKRVALTTEGYRFGRPDGLELISTNWIDEARYTATTDAAGRAFFAELPPRMPFAGTVWDGRDALFRAPQEIALEPGELREVAWRVGSGCTILGLALEESGAPAADLAIALQPARFAKPSHFERHDVEGRRFAKTDAEGRFAIADVGPGDWWIGAAPPRAGRQPAGEDQPAPAAQLLRIAPGAALAEVTIRVARGHAIRGRVLDPDGAPADFAFVHIERAADGLLAQENVHSNDGTFVLGPLEPGEYVLTGNSMGRFVDALPVTARTGDTDVVIQFGRGGAIHGVVLGADGKPAAPADVVVNGRVPGRWANMSSAADADGTFRFDGLEAGLYDVAARTADGRVGVATAIEVRAGEPPADARIATKPGARVRVRYDGPKSHVTVSVLQDGVVVHADGVEKGTEHTFVAPAGPCVVRASQHPERVDTDLRVELAAGATRELVFDGAWR